MKESVSSDTTRGKRRVVGFQVWLEVLQERTGNFSALSTQHSALPAEASSII